MPQSGSGARGPSIALKAFWDNGDFHSPVADWDMRGGAAPSPRWVTGNENCSIADRVIGIDCASTAQWGMLTVLCSMQDGAIRTTHSPTADWATGNVLGSNSTSHYPESCLLDQILPIAFRIGLLYPKTILMQGTERNRWPLMILEPRYGKRG